MTTDPRDTEIARLVAELTRTPGWPTLARRAVDTIKALTAEIARLKSALAESEAAAEGALMILVQTQAERDAALAQVARAHETAAVTP